MIVSINLEASYNVITTLTQQVTDTEWWEICGRLTFQRLSKDVLEIKLQKMLKAIITMVIDNKDINWEKILAIFWSVVLNLCTIK